MRHSYIDTTGQRTLREDICDTILRKCQTRKALGFAKDSIFKLSRLRLLTPDIEDSIANNLSSRNKEVDEQLMCLFKQAQKEGLESTVEVQQFK